MLKHLQEGQQGAPEFIRFIGSSSPAGLKWSMVRKRREHWLLSPRCRA